MFSDRVTIARRRRLDVGDLRRTRQPTPVSTDNAITLNDLLPDYEVGEEIGRGAMGIVRLGRHRHLGRPVAIKELPMTLVDDPEVRARFLSEARTLANLDHPNIVPIYDFVDRGGHCLIVMEALQGGTLWDRFTRQGLSMQTSCAAAIATACGVEHAHANGVLHRDIKPENLLFASTRQLKVTDFGIAKVISGERTMGTVDGSVLGTPAYMAPEQAEGEALGPAADVYAIGAVLFELLSGQLPFEGDSPMTLLVQRIMNEAPNIKTLADDVPSPIADVVAHALARDPRERIDSAAGLAAALSIAGEEVWGTDWLDSTEIELPDVARTTQRGSAASKPRPAAETVAPQRTRPSEPARGEPAKETVPPLRPASANVTVHPRTQHEPSAPPDVDRSQLVTVASLIKKPPPRWPFNLAAALAALATLALLLITPAAIDGDGLSTGGLPTINGIELDPNSVTTVPIDEPMLVEGLGDGSGDLTLDYAGLSLWSNEDPVTGGGVTIDLGPSGLAFSGPLTLSLGTGRPDPQAFIIQSDRRWYTTAQAPLLMAVMAIALSMIEFRLRSFRDGSIRIFMLIGTAVSTAVLAAAATALYAQYSERTFTLDALVPVAVAGAVAGVLTALARANHARARRRRKLGDRLASTRPIREFT